MEPITADEMRAAAGPLEDLSLRNFVWEALLMLLALVDVLALPVFVSGAHG